MVECAALEKQWARNRLGGSNPPSTAEFPLYCNRTRIVFRVILYYIIDVKKAITCCTSLTRLFIVGIICRSFGSAKIWNNIEQRMIR